MAKKSNKSLTDFEISIIKRLINDGIPNQIIMGMVNDKRGDPSLHINSGRVSDIKTGKSTRANSIPLATNKQLVEYQKEDTIQNEINTSSTINLTKLFPIRAENPLTLNITETDTIECKQSFSADEKSLLRPLCALANNTLF